MDKLYEFLNGLGLSPMAQNILFGVVVFIIVVYILRLIGRARESAYAARRRAELHKGMDAVRLKQEEVRRLAGRILATSSTTQIPGFEIIRQVEAVFSDGQKSAELAVDALKAHAAQKGANAIINLQTRQAPSGKWTAGGDAVMVKVDEGESGEE